MAQLLLIQTGEVRDSLLGRFGGFAAWLCAAMRVKAEQVRVVRVDQQARLPAPASVAGAVITGSGAMVTERADWNVRVEDWVCAAAARGVPMFGVCYGHQLMADAMGGRVGWLPGGWELGTIMVRRTERESSCAPDCMRGLPRCFNAQSAHLQTVLRAPRGAEVLATSEWDSCQIIAYSRVMLSTQFHPEFTPAHMRAVVESHAEELDAAGRDANRICGEVERTESARLFLHRFAHAALGNDDGTAACMG